MCHAVACALVSLRTSVKKRGAFTQKFVLLSARKHRQFVDGAFMMHGRKCALCQQGQQACSSLGPLLGPASGCYVHRQCAIWSPEVGASLLCLTHGDFQG